MNNNWLIEREREIENVLTFVFDVVGESVTVRAQGESSETKILTFSGTELLRWGT